MESSLDHICKNLKEAEGYKLSLSDVAGNGIFRASIYLKKVCNINALIRNIFVHSDGLISKKTGVELAKRNEGLRIAIIELDKVAIRFSREFTLMALQTIEHFFQTLQKAMRS